MTLPGFDTGSADSGSLDRCRLPWSNLVLPRSSDQAERTERLLT